MRRSYLVAMMLPLVLLVGCASAQPEKPARVVVGSGTADDRSAISSSNQEIFNEEHALSPDAPVAAGHPVGFLTRASAKFETGNRDGGESGSDAEFSTTSERGGEPNTCTESIIMFRPCIDLHEGKVKQIVGGSLTEGGARTNFVSDRSAAYFAELYKRDALTGGHVIKLGPGNDEEARAALAAWPGGMQIGGGITAENAASWLEAGASHVIVTSWIFQGTQLNWERLEALVKAVGKSRLVLDLSCRKRGDDYFVVTNRWQTFTALTISPEILAKLAESCAEFLVHAVDVEGLCRGIDPELVEKLGRWCSIPTTYAGGAKTLADLEETTRLGKGRVDLTIGSALDIFGGSGVRYADAVAFNRRMRATG